MKKKGSLGNSGKWQTRQRRERTKKGGRDIFGDLDKGRKRRIGENDELHQRKDLKNKRREGGMGAGDKGLKAQTRKVQDFSAKK